MVKKEHNSQVWTMKYLPKKLADVEGQDSQREQVRKFVQDYKRQKKKSMLIYGAPGCGKTSAVYALANELGLEVFELNASDFRNKDAIERILGSAIKQRSLFGRGKVILVDELDGVSGTKDRGGMPALIKLLKESVFPVVLVANDPFIKKFSALRKTAVLVEFNSLSFNSVFNVLQKIADKEEINYDEMALKSVARRIGGDLRAGINDLQILTMGRKSLSMENLEVLSDRERKEEITDALTKIFKTTDPKIAINAFDHVPEDLDKCYMWVDENLPKEYEKPEDLARAYYYLARADVMNRRIRRWQHWRFLVYINSFISAGVAVSKDEKYRKVVAYKQSERPLKIYLANMKYNKRKNIAAKIARKIHASAKEVIKDTLPYVKVMVKNDKQNSQAIVDYFDLDPDEVAWLKR